MKLFRRDLHSLSGAYALDALEPGVESERFARHLDRCPSCASELREFLQVATGLAFAATTEPPSELRDRVLAAAALTRQLPPEVTSRARSHRARGRARPRVPWLPWLSGVVATAAVVVAVLFGFARAHTEQELNQVRAQNQAIALVLSAPQAKLLTHATTKGGVATVVLAADRHELVVTTDGLPALPAGQVYQLWLIGTTKTLSAGLLPAATSGQTGPVLASGVVQGDKLGLTVEPAPGTTRPTTTPILALPLPV
jgi:anti-sigma-K factor RskA